MVLMKKPPATSNTADIPSLFTTTDFDAQINMTGLNDYVVLYDHNSMPHPVVQLDSNVTAQQQTFHFDITLPTDFITTLDTTTSAVKSNVVAPYYNMRGIAGTSTINVNTRCLYEDMNDD